MIPFLKYPRSEAKKTVQWKLQNLRNTSLRSNSKKVMTNKGSILKVSCTKVVKSARASIAGGLGISSVSTVKKWYAKFVSESSIMDTKYKFLKRTILRECCNRNPSARWLRPLSCPNWVKKIEICWIVRSVLKCSISSPGSQKSYSADIRFAEIALET